MVTTKTANHSQSETTRKQPETIQNQLKPPRNHPKPCKTTWNYFKPTQNFPKLAITSPTLQPTHCATSRQFLAYSSSVWTWIDESKVRKVKLGKDYENPSNDYESQIVEPFLQF